MPGDVMRKIDSFTALSPLLESNGVFPKSEALEQQVLLSNLRGV